MLTNVAPISSTVGVPGGPGTVRGSLAVKTESSEAGLAPMELMAVMRMAYVDPGCKESTNACGSVVGSLLLLTRVHVLLWSLLDSMMYPVTDEPPS